MPIDDRVATVSHVRCFKEEQQKAVASGFFYADSDRLFFVTNRHVVIKEDENYYPDEIRLRLHLTSNDIRQNDDFSLSLYNASGNPIWLEHTDKEANIDVVALPLDREYIRTRFFIKSFSLSNLIPGDVEIGIGEDILVMGYPMGFYDIVHNLPIIRSATLASIYPVPFSGRPMVLIDSRLHRGTSGSPVLTKPTQMLRRQDGSTSILRAPVSFLLGVHSASVDIRDRDPNQDEPLGLSVVWFAKLIMEIIS